MNIDDLLNNTEAIQAEMHKFISDMDKYSKKKDKKLQYKDLETIYFLTKISELQKEIEILKNKV